MSITSEIARLQQAKADIAEAIVAKGGEVSGKLDTYAQAIADLPSGGGISEEYYKKLISGYLDEPIIFPEGITKIPRYKFSYLNYENEEISPIIIIPDSVSAVEQYAFYYARTKKIIVPASVTTLGTAAFSHSETLEEIVINTVRYASSLCSASLNLKRAIFGGDTYMQAGTFNGCTSLEVVDISKATKVPSLSNVNAFADVPKTCEIRVPASLYDAWITATNWSTLYANGYNFVAV